MRAEHRATRHVGRLTKYNTLTGNTWGVLSPVFTRNHPPGTSRATARNMGERRDDLCRLSLFSGHWNVPDARRTACDVCGHYAGDDIQQSCPVRAICETC